MANPVLVTCTKDTWVKVATNVTVGQVHKMTEAPAQYNHTYRDTGEAAPTLKSEGVQIFIKNENSIPIAAEAGIDVYIMALEADGIVRVDL